MQIEPRTIKKLLVALLSFALIYGLIAIVLKAIGLENAQLWIKQAGALAPIVFVALCAFSLIVAPLSGSSLFVIGGALFGKETGFILSYLGSIVGCSANFAIARQFGRQVAARFVGKADITALDKLTHRLRSHQQILYLSLVLPIAQDIVSYAAGLGRIRFRNFLVALLISSVVTVAAYIYLGTSLLETVVKEG